MTTVRDAIDDLPKLEPTAEEKPVVLPYTKRPSSDYARMLRGAQRDLLNHVSKVTITNALVVVWCWFGWFFWLFFLNNN
jgi:hypothetical protein